ncbi:MAG: cytochrome P460 family protein [Pyrinomonadaceae bacterium]
MIPEKTSAPADTGNHDLSLGFVFANSKAAAIISEMKPDAPSEFPVGAAIVRERRISETQSTAVSLVVMIKRSKGFSEPTSDWEFLVLSGNGKEIIRRETVGGCFTCHTSQKNHDYVFTYGK